MALEERKAERVRAREEERIKILYTLLALVFLAILGLLSLHAIIVGPGTLVWDLGISFLAVFSTAILAIGVIFPITAALLIIAVPIIVLAVYLRNR